MRQLHSHFTRYDFEPKELEHIETLLQNPLLQAYIQNAAAEEAHRLLNEPATDSVAFAIKSAGISGAIDMAERFIRTDGGV